MYRHTSLKNKTCGHVVFKHNSEALWGCADQTVCLNSSGGVCLSKWEELSVSWQEIKISFPKKSDKWSSTHFSVQTRANRLRNNKPLCCHLLWKSNLTISRTRLCTFTTPVFPTNKQTSNTKKKRDPLSLPPQKKKTKKKNQTNKKTNNTPLNKQKQCL